MLSCVTSIADLRQQVVEDDAKIKRNQLESGPKASYGYGGKFGLQRDRMDSVRFLESISFLVCFLFCWIELLISIIFQSAVGNEYDGTVEKHASQKGYVFFITVGFLRVLSNRDENYNFPVI